MKVPDDWLEASPSLAPGVVQYLDEQWKTVPDALSDDDAVEVLSSSDLEEAKKKVDDYLYSRSARKRRKLSVLYS
jgi:hypothetical protein